MIPWNDVPVRVVRPEHLVAICLETGRMKDYERIARRLLEKWQRFMQRYQQGEWK